MSAKLNKLNDNIKKIDNYIKENNNKKVYIKKYKMSLKTNIMI